MGGLNVWVVDNREDYLRRGSSGVTVGTCIPAVRFYTPREDREGNGEGYSFPLRMPARERVRSLCLHVQKGKGYII